MSLLCELFGHKQNEVGYNYFTLKSGPVDGIGRVHCKLLARCVRCDTAYSVGLVHLKETAADLQFDKTVPWRNDAKQI